MSPHTQHTGRICRPDATREPRFSMASPREVIPCLQDTVRTRCRFLGISPGSLDENPKFSVTRADSFELVTGCRPVIDGSLNFKVELFDGHVFGYERCCASRGHRTAMSLGRTH